MMRAEVVGGSGLNGLFILHHGFHGEGGFRAGEALGFGFFTHDDRDSEEIADRVGVELVDAFPSA